MERRLVSSEAASVAGRIFAVRGGSGWFPALVPAKSSRRVCGTLCELDLRPGECALLDRYEGAEYRRVAMPVRTRARAMSSGQVYQWCAPLPDHARPVLSGDFLAWLHENRLLAFSAMRSGA